MIAQSGTLELSASRLLHNLGLFRTRAAPAVVCATLKADAYGHGARLIAPMLAGEGVDWACVYNLDEAFQLAEIVPAMNVLVLSPVVGPVDSEIIAALAGSRIRISVQDMATLEQLSTVGGAILRVHVQIDTGLTRSGVPMGEAPALLERAMRLEGIELEGVFSHLSHGDVAGHETLARQAAALERIAAPVKRARPKLLVHLQNSGGAWQMGEDISAAGGTGLRTAQTRGTPLTTFPELDMVRIGIGLYGLQPSMTDRVEGLLPVAKLTAPILAIHEVGAGIGAGYGHTFVTRRASRLAIVPVGYADGYPRALSNQGVVQVRGCDAAVVGRVSMDQIIVDVTDIAGAAVGDDVVVMSDDPVAENGVDRIAARVGTIGYEIATGFGARLRRVVVD